MIEHFELLKKLYGDEMNNLELWNKIKQPPLTALKEIKAGRLKGKSDINPQWRMQALTEQFGQCGVGWKYTIDKLWAEPGSAEQIMCFALVSLYTFKGVAEGWSDSIPGIGGSMLVTKESSGLHSSDEGYKMAVTDALSVAMKSLGMAADIYLGNYDGSKYKQTELTPDQIRDALHEQYADQIIAIKDSIASGDYSVAASIWFELDREDKSALWVARTKGGVFTIQEREVMKSEQFRKSHFGETA